MKHCGPLSERGRILHTGARGHHVCRYYSFLGELVFTSEGRTEAEAFQKIRVLRDAYNARLRAFQLQRSKAPKYKWSYRNTRGLRNPNRGLTFSVRAEMAGPCC